MVSRRSFLSSLGVAAGAALAGCVRPDESESATVVESTLTTREGSVGNEPRLVSRERRTNGNLRLVVEGAVSGRNGCYTDVSGDVTTEESDVTANIAPALGEDASETDVCTQVITNVPYRLELVLRGRVEHVDVNHKGVNGGSFRILPEDESENPDA